MKGSIVLVIFLLVSMACERGKDTTKNPNSVKSEVDPITVVQEGKTQKLKEKFIHFVAIEGASKQKEPLVKEFSREEILNATFKLYVEAIPVNSDTKWVKGNDPRKKEKNIDFENVRAVCLGVEDGQYVFLTLRYFLDFTYPNPNIQGFADLVLAPSGKPTKSNADFVSYSQMYRLMLSDVRHTGGGQILTRKTVSCTLKNDFTITEVGKYDFLSNYSTISGKQYKDPIKGVLTAVDVTNMEQEIKAAQWASIQAFGNHDICLIKTPKQLWGDLQLTNLGLEHPTETIRVLTEKQRYLYGFEFILFSKDAYQAVMHYKVPDNAKQSGIYRLVLFASEIMGVEQVFQIRLLDKLLLRVFQQGNKKAYTDLSDVEMVGMALDFSQEFLDYRRQNF